VPVEWGWDRVTFLRQTCRKAGLDEDAWKNPGTDIYWFEGVVF
jgi:AMMECR1 domain-containing protein